MEKKLKDLPSGVIVPVITPFKLSEILPVIDNILKGGVTGIFLLGTTGEGLKVSFNQKKSLIKNVADHVKNRAHLLVSITSQTVKESLELMELVHSTSAYASVIAPAVMSPNCAAIVDELLSKGPGNLFLYNYPKISAGRFIPIEHITPYMSESRVIGIKDSSGDMKYFDEILHRKKGHFRVFYGPEDNLLEALKRDINGFVPGTGNIASGLAQELWQKKELGPWEKWNAIKAEMGKKDPQNYIKALKVILMERGLITDPQLFV